MFKPKSLALIGASDKPGSVGHVVTRNIISAGFHGEFFPINPKYQTIEGFKAYPDVASLPKAPELAVILTPPDAVPGVIAQLGEKGTKAAVVVTAGLKVKLATGTTPRVVPVELLIMILFIVAAGPPVCSRYTVT